MGIQLNGYVEREQEFEVGREVEGEEIKSRDEGCHGRAKKTGWIKLWGLNE